MMVGYVEKHYGDMYHLWNPVTEHVHVTKDIIWLKQMMFQKRVEEDKAKMLPDVKAELVEGKDQDVAVPVSSRGANPLCYCHHKIWPIKASIQIQGRDVCSSNHWTGLKNYCAILYKEEDDDEDNSAELACVGAELGGLFENTLELYVMNYKAAIKTADNP